MYTPNKYEEIPLHLAVKQGNPRLVKILLIYFKDIDLNIPDMEGNTALDNANASGNREIIELLARFKNGN